MTAPFSFKVTGVPYSQEKVRGDVGAAKRWTEDVIWQTKNIVAVKGPCELDVTFILPCNKFPKDYPFGPDLDNLLKRLLDALNQTIFREVAGKDSCIVMLQTRKMRAANNAEAGVIIKILPSAGV